MSIGESSDSGFREPARPTRATSAGQLAPDAGAEPEADAAVLLGAQLVERVRAGDDPAAMQELLRFLEPYVGRWCGPIALQDGPDAVQETLLIVFRRLRQLKKPAALLGWVRMIAIREAVRLAARSDRTVVPELAELPSRADVETASDVRDVLERLSPEHRAVLVLRDLEELDERSAAAILGVSVGTVKSRLHRARRSFRRSWQ